MILFKSPGTPSFLSLLYQSQLRHEACRITATEKSVSFLSDAWELHYGLGMDTRLQKFALIMHNFPSIWSFLFHVVHMISRYFPLILLSCLVLSPLLILLNSPHSKFTFPVDFFSYLLLQDHYHILSWDFILMFNLSPCILQGLIICWSAILC